MHENLQTLQSALLEATDNTVVVVDEGFYSDRSSPSKQLSLKPLTTQ
jgi:hypothetical protein